MGERGKLIYSVYLSDCLGNRGWGEREVFIDLMPTVLSLRHSLWCLCLPGHSFLAHKHSLTLSVTHVKEWMVLFIVGFKCDLITRDGYSRRAALGKTQGKLLPFFIRSPSHLLSGKKHIGNYMMCMETEQNELLAFHTFPFTSPFEKNISLRGNSKKTNSSGRNHPRLLFASKLGKAQRTGEGKANRSMTVRVCT